MACEPASQPTALRRSFTLALYSPWQAQRRLVCEWSPSPNGRRYVVNAMLLNWSWLRCRGNLQPANQPYIRIFAHRPNNRLPACQMLVMMMMVNSANRTTNRRTQKRNRQTVIHFSCPHNPPLSQTYLASMLCCFVCVVAAYTEPTHTARQFVRSVNTCTIYLHPYTMYFHTYIYRYVCVNVCI